MACQSSSGSRCGSRRWPVRRVKPCTSPSKTPAVVGFCAVAAPSRDEDADDDVAEIAAICVDPDAWRVGVGRALMDVALADLRADGWRWVTLWVLAENHPARDFYARFGFEPDGAEMTHESRREKEVRLRGRVTA